MYKISQHAKERYAERFPCRVINRDVFHSITEDLANSTEVNHWRNDTNFMIKLYEKHGYDVVHKFNIIDDVVFVIDEVKGVVVTVYDANKTKWAHSAPRYRKCNIKAYN